MKCFSTETDIDRSFDVALMEDVFMADDKKEGVQHMKVFSFFTEIFASETFSNQLFPMKQFHPVLS